MNLGLFLGASRPGDGRHEIVTVMQSVSLADTVELGPAGGGARHDELHCPGVGGAAAQNLAARALADFRERCGWRAPPLRIAIEKRIPVAAGLAGGSADAAAALRLARELSGLGDEDTLRELALGLGADVPAQLQPGRWLASGAGEALEALPDPGEPLELVLLASAHGLATGEVYREADRLGLARGADALTALRGGIRTALAGGAALPAERDLLANDLQAAAVSLLPEIGHALERAAGTGADRALLCGSGPTVAALFAGQDAAPRAEAAAEMLADLRPAPIRCRALAAGDTGARASAATAACATIGSAHEPLEHQ